MQAIAIEHMVYKGNQIERNRPKLPYGHGRGGVSVDTEFRREYTGKYGDRSDKLKPSDNINFGKERFFETTHQNKFPNNIGDPVVRNEFDQTQMLKNEIKVHGRDHKVMKCKEDHADKYYKSVPGGENNVKPGSWMKGKLDRKELPFNPNTTTGDDYKGHHGVNMEKQNERFDNLKSTGPICRDKTEYREKYHARTPDLSATREMFGHNKSKGKNGHRFLDNPDTNTNTTYHRGFNDTLKVGDLDAKPHFGKDDQTKEFLYQMHRGFYYTDNKK